jgi:glycosyltransferase involved in cell wall biosynthesis
MLLLPLLLVWRRVIHRQITLTTHAAVLMMLVSIIITNYNYGDFLAQAIDSALGQTWPDKEVIVVDDGSTDQSADVIESYGNSITAVFKGNEGQCSAANAGFEISRGDIVIFLDSDDYLMEGAVSALAGPIVEDPSVSKCQGYLMAISSAGTPTGQTIPKRLSPSGDYRDKALLNGPDTCRFAYTSGNAWPRWFLEQVMPLPVPKIKRMGVDGYLNAVSTLFGRTVSVNQIVAAYRIHGSNQGPVSTIFTEESLRQRANLIEMTQDHFLRWARRLEYTVSPDDMKRWGKGWRHSLLNYSLNAMAESPQRISFAELVMSPFHSCHTNTLRALYLSASLSILWLLPYSAGLELARWMLKLPRPAS